MSRPPHTPQADGDRIAVGIIRKPHGIRGEASVEPWTDSADRFEELRNLTLVSPRGDVQRPARIAGMRVHAGRVLLHFEGIDTPEEIGELRGWTLEIPESQARTLPPDEYFLHDLVGMKLVDEEGRDRGTILEADEGGSGVLFTVKRPDGHRFAVPFAASICTRVDLAQRTITVELPDGIEDLEGLRSIEDEVRAKSPQKKPVAAPEGTGS